jgi:hypothetical protein
MFGESANNCLVQGDMERPASNLFTRLLGVSPIRVQDQR